MMHGSGAAMSIGAVYSHSNACGSSLTNKQQEAKLSLE